MRVSVLSLLHFNDVYRVAKQRLPSGTIDVSQFYELVNSIRNSWGQTQDGMLLFSGDVFSPSVESSVTRGSHMVPVMNMIRPDVALTGNHDFDFGYPHLCKLIADCKFPWILSNIIDSRTNDTPAQLEPFRILKLQGLSVGVIGLVEENWIATVPSWPPEFRYRDMAEVAIELSKRLRDPDGEHQCDIVIALTHARIPNDINLAKRLHATNNIEEARMRHGVDLILGGHDHIYYIGRGIEKWGNYQRAENEPGTEEDDGVRLIKSGTDFRDLSEALLELEDSPHGSVRKKVIRKVEGKRHQITPDMPSSKEMKDALSKLLSDVSASLGASICYTITEWDVRSEVVRMDESAIGNWMADVLRHAYDDAIWNAGQREGGADGVLICGGTLRGDSRYEPGKITIGDILEILPFDDPVVVIEIDGATLWDALESALSTFPSQEGRFPVISGFQVEWDSRKPPRQRVLGIWLTDNVDPSHPHVDEIHSRREAVARQEGGRLYKVVSRQFMCDGYDGYDALKGRHYLVDDESGIILSSIIRKFLLGSQYIHVMKQLTAKGVPGHLDAQTKEAIARARAEWVHGGNSPVTEMRMKWVEATNKVLHASQAHSRRNISDALRIGGREHMSPVDPFDGQGARLNDCKVQPSTDGENAENLVHIQPVKDGRLRDVGRASALM